MKFILLKNYDQHSYDKQEITCPLVHATLSFRVDIIAYKIRIHWWQCDISRISK